MGVLRRTVREFREDNMTDWAAALTYYGLLSVFPALIVFVSIVGLFADPEETTRTLTEIVNDIGPESSAETFSGPIESLTSHRKAAGILLVLGFLTAIYSASGYIGAYTRALNVIYETPEGRPYWKLKPLQILIALAMVVGLMLIALSIALTGPVVEAVADAAGHRRHAAGDLEHREVARRRGLLHAPAGVSQLHDPQREAARLPLGDAGQPLCAGHLDRRLCPFRALRCEFRLL